MNVICNSCSQKEDLINKYTKLIKLLKTKYQKSSKSTIKSQNLSTQSHLQSCESSMKDSSSNIEPLIFDSYRGQTASIMDGQKKQNQRLAMMVICNRVKKSLLKSCIDQIKLFTTKSLPIESVSFGSPQCSVKNPSSILDLIQEAMSHGKRLQLQSKNPVTTLKSLYTESFSLQNINIQLRQKANKLQQELKASEKRFYKQTEKKRQGLEAVAQEILEKNDFIAELQHTIKQYQKISGKSFKKINVQNVLVEDQLQLKKTCFRLQNINEKLNSDLKNAQIQISELNSQIESLSKQNISFKSQLTQLKEHNFDLLQQVQKSQNLTQTYTNLCQKLNQKLDKIKFTQKKGIDALKSNSKGSDIVICGDVFSFKNTQTSSDLSPLSRKSSFRQLEAEQKVESIFSFLFNIHEEAYQIMNQDMFDEDEINLLKSHKNSFLNNIHNQNPQKKPRTQKVIKNSSLDETDEIFYIQEPKTTVVENSFLNALEPEKDFCSKPLNVSNNLKLMDLEVQKSKLIEKIADLKKVHMHIREVLLKLLKTIQFTNLKPETVQILEIIFDVFEYSEDEKSTLIKEKKKKLWGIL